MRVALGDVRVSQTMGVGMTIGNIAGGFLADHDLRRSLVGGLAALALILALLAVTASSLWALVPLVFATGFVSAVLSPTIQTRLMDVAGDNQSIAAALNHSALNIGNSLGALLGGTVIAAGWGFVAPAWAGVVLAVAGLAIAVISLAAERRAAAAPPAAEREPVLARS